MAANTRYDSVESDRQARRVKSIPKACYRNARAVLVRGKEFADCSYVEGVAVRMDIGIPMEHAWVERPDGMVIDPSWVTKDTTIEIRYYAAERRPAAEMKLTQRRDVPLFPYGSRNMWSAWYEAFCDLSPNRTADEDKQLRRMFNQPTEGTDK